MNKISFLVCAVWLSVSGLSAMAAETKTYQVTGPVLEVTDTSVTVQKGTEKWVLERDKDTKITGDLKVGAKVTIQYRMIATTGEVKEDKKKVSDEKKPTVEKKK
jgi:hypothetical protein